MKKIIITMLCLLATAWIVTTDCYADTIYACVQEKTGLMRLVSAGTDCKVNERMIYWNTEGFSTNRIYIKPCKDTTATFTRCYCDNPNDIPLSAGCLAPDFPDTAIPCVPYMCAPYHAECVSDYTPFTDEECSEAGLDSDDLIVGYDGRSISWLGAGSGTLCSGTEVRVTCYQVD